MIKLIGIAVVALGFALNLNTLLVVVGAGIVTGLVAGMSFHEIVEQFGRLFVENRYMTMTVVLIVPVVGLLERYGLRERAEAMIQQMRGASAGRILLLYTAIRQVSIALGINIGGHAGAVRPLVAPMAEGAARARHGELPERSVDLVRAHAAAAENVGNFFGEDVFIAVGSILLMKGFFDAQGVEVSAWAMALWAIPTAVVAFGVMAWRARALDRRLDREAQERSGSPKGPRIP